MEVKKWKTNKSGIIKSIEKVVKTKNIDNLSMEAYQFINIASGFIAHYDINGFKYEYQNVADFVRDLQNSMDVKNPSRYLEDPYFSKGDQKEYYADKGEILKFIAELVENLEVKDHEEEYKLTKKVSSY